MTDISADTATSIGAPGFVTMSQIIADEFQLRAHGFIGDGNSHPLSSINSIGSTNTTGWTLTQWQTIFSFATALTNEIDGLAVQAVINSMPATQSYQIIFPAGTWNCSLTITTEGSNVYQGNVRIKGAGQAVSIMNVEVNSPGKNGWRHNHGQNPDYPLCNLQMEDMSIMCTCTGSNIGGVGLDVTCTTAQGSGLEGAFGVMLDRMIVSGIRTTAYEGNYWQNPIIIRGGGGACLNKVLVGDASATYSLNNVGNALTFNGNDSSGTGDIGLTNIIVEDCDFNGYIVGVEFNTSTSYGVQGTWICNCNFACYQGIVYNSTYSATADQSPQNFVLDCQMGGCYGNAVVATGVCNLIIRNLSYFLGLGNQGLPTGAALGASFLLHNCYAVVIENGFWLLDISGVPYVVDCDPYTFDVLLKDNYIVASKPPAVFIRSQSGAAGIKERNTTFQNSVLPTTMWVNGNSTKNGCIVESWINLFNSTGGSGNGARCSVDNLGTITYSTSQVADTNSSGVFAAAFPTRNSINLFDVLSVVICINGDNNVNSDLAIPIGSMLTNTGFHAQYVGLTSASPVCLNFTATGI